MNTQRSSIRDTGGVTLAELVIALALLSIGFLAAVAAFQGLAKGIFVTKTKSLATNIAQEQVEFLKDRSYYRLRVTSATVVASGSNVLYDPYNYSPETTSVGGIPFTAYTMVEKVRKNASTNDLEVVPFSDPDTGLKRIKVTIAWQEGADWKTFSLQNLRENPSRAAANVTFQGTVTSTASVAIGNVIVEVAENPNWRAETTSLGAYTMNVEPGTWTVRASTSGYFTASAGGSISTTNSPVTVNLQMTRQSVGSATGSVWLRDHPVITQIVGSSNSATIDQEWVEIYNPTTWTWTAAALGLRFESAVSNSSDSIAIVYLTTGISPNGFYLFANTGTVSAYGATVSADAVWEQASGGTNDINLNTPTSGRFVPGSDPNVITTKNDAIDDDWARACLTLYSTSTNQTLDKVGWKGNGSQVAPDKEGTAIDQAQGLEDNEMFYRFSSTAGYNTAYGPAYDSGDNDIDFNPAKPIDVVSITLKSAATTATPVSGTPAVGAYVFASDGLSQSVQAASTGSPPYASFSITSVATGAWIVASSSGGAYKEEAITVTAGSSSDFRLALSSEATSGVVSGRVTNISGSGLSGIFVNPGFQSTDSAGYYRLSVAAGTKTVTANPGSYSANYVEASSIIVVTAGLINSNVNFSISAGGKIKGRVTIDGTNALPDVPVSIVNNNTSVEEDNVLSDANGYFEVSVPTGPYVASPIAEFGEVVTPSSSAVTTVTSGGTIFTSTFTVGPALGTISGLVRLSGDSITSGVLIIASTGTISDPPPAVNSTLRSSGLVYYMASSMSDGTYTMDVRDGTYNMKAWYTTFSGTTATTQVRSLSSVAVTAGATSSGKNFDW